MKQIVHQSFLKVYLEIAVIHLLSARHASSDKLQ